MFCLQYSTECYDNQKYDNRQSKVFQEFVFSDISSPYWEKIQVVWDQNREPNINLFILSKPEGAYRPTAYEKWGCTFVKIKRLRIKFAQHSLFSFICLYPLKFPLFHNNCSGKKNQFKRGNPTLVCVKHWQRKFYKIIGTNREISRNVLVT